MSELPFAIQWLLAAGLFFGGLAALARWDSKQEKRMRMLASQELSADDAAKDGQP